MGDRDQAKKTQAIKRNLGHSSDQNYFFSSDEENNERKIGEINLAQIVKSQLSTKRSLDIDRKDLSAARPSKKSKISLFGQDNPLQESLALCLIKSFTLHPVTSSKGPSPVEIVFEINHILELIFSSLNQESLFNCRLVSNRWASFSSKALQKIMTLEFGPIRLEEDDEEESRLCEPPSPIFRNLKYPHRSLDELTTLINNSKPISSKILSAQFPCTYFIFYHSDIINPAALSFLNIHGHLIKKLKLSGQDVSSLHRRHSIYLEDLKRLLETQCQNLEHLILDGKVVALERDGSPSLEWDPDMEDISEWIAKSKPKPMHPTLQLKPNLVLKLMYFQCNSSNSSIPENIVQEILQSSSNLRQIDLHYENVSVLLNPVNRLHLLQTLAIELNNKTLASLQFLADHHQGCLAPRELIVEFSDVLSENLHSQSCEVIAKLLCTCSASCEKLVWEQMRILHHLQVKIMHFPQMSKVKHLTLRISELVQLFPLAGYKSIAFQFPNLDYLFIDKVISYAHPLPVSNFIGGGRNQNLLDNMEPAPSVMNVSLKFFPNTRVLECLRKMFPNAKLYHIDKECDVSDWDLDFDCESDQNSGESSEEETLDCDYVLHA